MERKYKCPYCNKVLKYSSSRATKLNKMGYVVFKHSCNKHILWNLYEEPKEFEWVYRHLTREQKKNLNKG